MFWPHDLHMQLIRTIWTILVGDHPGTIPVEFGQIPISGSRQDVIWSFPYIMQCKIVTPPPKAGSILTPGTYFKHLWWRTSRWCYIPNMKALSLVVSEKKIFESCIFKIYLLTPWPTYATNQNHLNIFGRGPLRNHSCEV